MMYGFLSGSLFPIFATFLTGSILAIAYLSVYFCFTLERRRVLRYIVVVALWNVLTLLFAFSGSEFLGITNISKSQTGDYIGYIAAATSLLLYASPFATLAHVLKTRSVASIPIALVLAGALNSAFWAVYGFMESDEIVSVPNSICLVFNCIQTAVYYTVSWQNKKNPPPAACFELTPGNKGKRDANSLTTVDIDADRSSVVVVVADDTVSDDHAFMAIASPRPQ